jgi:aarF domain-containing kinase
LDYVQEGRNAERFARLYGDRPDIVVPSIEWQYTSPRVITMEWIEGTKLSDQESLAAQGLDVLKLVDSGIQCSLRQLLEFGYFHADPHPGNLLATRDGRLAFLDFGMMSEMPESARYAIIDHVVHLVNRDYVEMANDYYALEFLDESVDVTPIVPALAEFFDDVLEATVEELNFKTITDGLGAVLYKYPFNVPGYYALILRSLTVLEGLALSTDPKFKVLAKAYPYMARRLLTDPRPELRKSFAELLFKDGQFRWNRLENLLREGRKSDDYNAAGVIPPLIELAIGEDKPGEEKNILRPLIEAETVKVLEAILLGGAMEGARSDALAPIIAALPEQFRALPPLTMGSAKQEKKLMEKRDQVLRVVELLSSSKGFDPQALQPFAEALRKPSASVFVQHVAGGLAERVAARMVNVFLLSQDAAAAKPTSASSSAASATANARAASARFW